jgi:hypothetical protein
LIDYCVREDSGPDPAAKEGPMPIAYRCDGVKGITYAVWHGLVSAQQWEANANRQFEDPEWPAGELYITDLASALIDDLEVSKISDRMAEKYRDRITHPLKHAIISPANFSTVDKFQESMSKRGFNYMVFTDLATACFWLGIDFKTADNTMRELRAELRNPSH